ncbi:MBL fold metallo-hydrolase [Halieaceae bacterium IMCC14734]|uniref:MBL fold metallo-hydrolase n=1 Tax=Candidatus Litorirhabdus singularis TaxID=2518993 RepID=A0ABT3TKA1_9GAMM|nr:MBL fold metallo-hydrolase [Candidatus Litorirhabdus singularis]MCX2982752.1 MBL fold metallo-hydrolase [Candidatus Litorirhabdus singularis]
MSSRQAPTLQFLGAAGTVTGSRYLLTSPSGRVLIDCGMYQGYKKWRELNWQPFPVPAASIDALVLTHAHLDHSGYIPALVAQGFTGPVYCSQATFELCEILLLDAAHLQEEEAAYRNRRGYTRHAPALPLFTVEQAHKALTLFKPLAVETEHDLDMARVSLYPNGHILGSCSVDVEVEGRHITFTGDLGRSNDLQMPAPLPPRYCDYLVTESTYGDRLHSQVDVEGIIANIVSITAARGGSVLIPSFAVGRAQLLIHILSKLKRAGRIPEMAIYLDSPMAIRATRTMRAHQDLSRFTAERVQQTTEDVEMVETADESEALASIQMPIIIISASGMATGGRVLHHLKRMLPQHRDCVLFAGYQAGGTRGAKLVAGDGVVKIHGREVSVKAQIESMDFLSAHADYEGLLDWMRQLPVAPKGCFITHGEPEAAGNLQRELREQLGWRAEVPELGESFEL